MDALGSGTPSFRYMSRVAARGATSRKSSTRSLPCFTSCTRAKPPPPMPEWYGPTTARVKAAATAASTALPPLSIISTAAWLAYGCAVATAPPR